MGTTSFDLRFKKKKKKQAKLLSVNKSKVNYWGNIVKAVGSTPISEHNSSLNSASNSHKKQITLYSAMYIRKL